MQVMCVLKIQSKVLKNITSLAESVSLDNTGVSPYL